MKHYYVTYVDKMHNICDAVVSMTGVRSVIAIKKALFNGHGEVAIYFIEEITEDEAKRYRENNNQ